MKENPYIDNYEKAAEYLRLSLLLLTKSKLPASPLHYRMAYDSVAGYGDVLNKALATTATMPAEAVEDLLWKHYQSTYVQDHMNLDNIRQELAQLIDNMQKDMERSGGTLNSYSSRLKVFLEMLETPRTSREIEVEVRRVINDTREAAQSHMHFEAQVHQILDEIETLRNELIQVRQASLTDSLTGIANRAAFDIHLAQAMESSCKEEKKHSLLLADIDYFKTINDSFGHLVGDRVLRYVATLLKRCVKGNDFVARFGGEEFAVLLPYTDLSGAYAVAEHIRQTISNGRLKDVNNEKTCSRITISIGVVEFVNGELPSNLIERADRLLYQAKSAGRNRCEMHA